MKRLYFLLLASFIYISAVFPQNEKFKAIFIYNFTKYIDWPASYKQGDFVIGVLGNTPLYDELVSVAQKRKVTNQEIVVKRFNSIDAIEKCHMLYIPENRSNSLGDVRKKLGNSATLIITDKHGLSKEGSGINFVVVDGKQQFEINRTSIQGTGMGIDAGLLSLGVIVN